MNCEDLKHHDDLEEAWDHCKKQSKCIEVLYKNEDEDQKVLATVHFRSYSSVSIMYTVNNIVVCSNILWQDELPDELVEKVKYQVKRDSAEDKTRDFLKWMKAAKKEMFHLVCPAIAIHKLVILLLYYILDACFVQTALRQRWYTNMFVYNM